MTSVREGPCEPIADDTLSVVATPAAGSTRSVEISDVLRLRRNATQASPLQTIHVQLLRKVMENGQIVRIVYTSSPVKLASRTSILAKNAVVDVVEARAVSDFKLRLRF